VCAVCVRRVGWRKGWVGINGLLGIRKKGKEEYLYSAFYILRISQSAQAWITQTDVLPLSHATNCLAKPGLALTQHQPPEWHFFNPIQRTLPHLSASAHVSVANILTLLSKALATVTVYRGHRQTPFFLPRIISLFITCIGIIRNNSLVDEHAQSEVWPWPLIVSRSTAHGARVLQLLGHIGRSHAYVVRSFVCSLRAGVQPTLNPSAETFMSVQCASPGRGGELVGVCGVCAHCVRWRKEQ